MKLARALKREHVTMYGTHWCGFCNRERQAFGKEAFALVDYVECDAGGVGGDPQRCYDAGVEAYPSWIVGSSQKDGSAPPSKDAKRATGAQGLDGLERLVGLPSPPLAAPAVLEPPAVEQPSSERALALAAALKAKQATLYGAYWCGFCNQERQALGQEASAMVNYVECDPRGKNAEPLKCADAGVSAYPTWVLPGQGSFLGRDVRKEGALGMQGLEDLVGLARADAATTSQSK
jgi:glutaredoxin